MTAGSRGQALNVLVVGESWVKHTVHMKGFDQFQTTEYEEGGGVFLEALREAGQADQLQLQRLKKRKLLLRDKLAQLEDQLTPDIIA